MKWDTICQLSSVELSLLILGCAFAMLELSFVGVAAAAAFIIIICPAFFN